MTSTTGDILLLALIAGGLLLALTRRNPFLKASPYARRWQAA